MARKEQEDPAKAAKSTMNMTPMIDVTFQLIVVFLCTMKFRSLDQKIEAFLPKDVGLATYNPQQTVETKLTVTLKRRLGQTETEVRVLGTKIGMASDAGIWNNLSRQILDMHKKEEKMKGEIEAFPEVPHGEVMKALDAFLGAKLNSVVFKGTQFNKSGEFGAAPPPK